MYLNLAFAALISIEVEKLMGKIWKIRFLIFWLIKRCIIENSNEYIWRSTRTDKRK